MASASVMTEAVKGRTVTQTRELYRRFTALLSEAGAPEAADDLGEVAVLAVVRAFPSRRNCAALAWHTLVAALEGRDEHGSGFRSNGQLVGLGGLSRRGALHLLAEPPRHPSEQQHARALSAPHSPKIL